MAGSMTFEESLKIRLDIIKPSLSQLKDFIKTQPPTLTPGVKYITHKNIYLNIDLLFFMQEINRSSTHT